MDIKALKEITKLMRDNDLVEVEIESKDLKVKLKKATAAVATVTLATPAPAPVASIPAPAPAAPAAAPAAVDESAGWTKVISPIPGTVYLKPNPDSANYVSVGSTVEEGKVLCLVEAMKVFNEIKADAGVKGQIKRICVSEGQPVEYGTVLFLVG